MDRPSSTRRRLRALLTGPLALFASVAPQAALAEVAPSGGFVEVRGARLFVRELGDGPPIVVLHGGPGWEHGMLLPSLRPLADGHRLIFLDQRASGRSPIEGLSLDSMTVESIVADVEALRARLGHERISLLGHSFGGRLALRYAIAHPERVDRLLLVSPTAASSRFLDEVNRTMSDRLGEEGRARRDRLIASGAFSGESPEAYQEALRLIVSANFHEPALAERLTFPLASNLERRGELLDALISGAAPYDFTAQLSRIRAPTLLVRGASEALPREAAEEIVQSIPEARLVELDACGHFAFVECPDRLLAVLRDFLKG